MSRFSPDVEVHGNVHINGQPLRLLVRPSPSSDGPAVEFQVNGQVVFCIEEDLLTLLAQAFGGKP